MKVRKFLNKFKTWFNVKFDYVDNSVYINFLENYLDIVDFDDKSHLEIPEPERILNKNKLFKLVYPDSSEILVGKTGQVYSSVDFLEDEINTIKIDALPLRVASNFDITTAIYPSELTDFQFCLYNGLITDQNHAVASINDKSTRCAFK